MTISKKSVADSIGAKCNNWQFAWSYINKSEKIILFGLWHNEIISKNKGLIFSEDWQHNPKGRPKGFTESMGNIERVQTGGFSLKVFIMYENTNSKKLGIGRVEEKIYDGFLIKEGVNYFITSHEDFPLLWNQSKIFITEEIDPSDPSLHEGSKKQITVNAYERSPEARKKCIEHYGYNCQICNFDFQERFGELGAEYIHVHHIKPLHTIGETYVVDPVKDLIPLCPNCHAMIHRRRPELSISELKKILQN